MVAKIDGVDVPTDFQDGDTLLYDCTASLPAIDELGNVLMEEHRKCTKILDNGIEVSVLEGTAEMKFEKVVLKAGKITSNPQQDDCEAKARRWVCSILFAD